VLLALAVAILLAAGESVTPLVWARCGVLAVAFGFS
jgi:hypothetical protein